jgi:uncharacterized protein YndB with AHSA1/START domain
MTVVTDVHQDADALTLTITSVFGHPPAHVWQAWENPRLLERWWGPPTYPATVEVFELRPTGRVTYFMTGPEGDRHAGYWNVVSVEPPHAIEFVDGFADSDGVANDAMPTTRTRVDLAATDDGGTTMTITTTFPSLDAMEQMAAMGMVEGMSAALGQIPALLDT